MHRHGVIHKDINPSNLVWNGERRLLQLIDFGIAGELPQETQGVVNPHALEGTLRYMAPEQTGRMNRLVDYRADFYALGATFYELLTGQAPFAALDAMELVHCHIARTPDWSHPALRQPARSLLAIVQRLLEKNRRAALPEPAWPAARPRGLPRGGAGAGCRLSDRNGRFLMPQTLHGRDTRSKRCWPRSNAAPPARPRCCWWPAIPASASRRVVNEVHKPIVARRGCFLSGKFDQFRRDVPYASLIQAFQGLVRQLLSEPDEALRQWAAKLRAALGSGLGVMVELIPELALIVGATEPVPAAGAGAGADSPEPRVPALRRSVRRRRPSAGAVPRRPAMGRCAHLADDRAVHARRATTATCCSSAPTATTKSTPPIR